jgi:hypothetical protein
MRLTSGGNVGIGTTSPSNTLTVVGSACFSQGAGVASVACGSTSGNTYAKANNTGNYDVAENYVTSDLTLVPGEIVALDPFHAQAIVRASAGAVPFGVISTAPGVITHGALPALHLTALGELTAFGSTTASSTPPGSFMDTFLHNLFARITTWLGDSANGIDKIFAKELDAKNIFADRVTANAGSFGSLTASSTITGQELCVADANGKTCVTRAQLDAMLAAAAATSIGARSPTVANDNPPPAGQRGTLTLTEIIQRSGS